MGTLDHPLNSLARLSNLRSLLIYDTILTDDLVEIVSDSLTDLQELSLWDCHTLSESSVSHLSRMHSLEKLSLHRFNALKESSLESLVGLNSLQRLELYLCKNLANASLERLGSMKRLAYLTICPHLLGDCQLMNLSRTRVKLVKDDTQQKAESRVKHLLRKIKNTGLF